MTRAVIRAENLFRVLEGEVPVRLVANATLEIHAGEFVAITGPSGSGKSSLLYLLGLLDKQTSGKLWLFGEETSALNENQLADFRLARLGYIFQFHFLLPEFTALENVMLPMRKLAQRTEAEMQKEGERLLESLGMQAQMHKLPKQLSGGQSQRVAIARSLANAPRLILADEPTGNLDSHSSENVQQILRALAREKGHTIVAVTHDPEFAKQADRIIHIVDGKIHADSE